VTRFGVATAAGVTTFLLVTVAVTTLFERWIEFSVFVGLPAGLLAGVLAFGAVAYRLAGAAPARRRRLVGAVGGFCAAFLLALLWLTVGWNGSVALSIGVALLVGVLGLLIGYVSAFQSVSRELPPESQQ
jgi:hypothetical protein